MLISFKLKISNYNYTNRRYRRQNTLYTFNYIQTQAIARCIMVLMTSSIRFILATEKIHSGPVGAGMIGIKSSLINNLTSQVML